MGLKEQMKQHEELSKEGVFATFTDSKDGINIRATIHASRSEIMVLLCELVDTISTHNHPVTEVLAEVGANVMLRRQMKGNEDD